MGGKGGGGSSDGSALGAYLNAQWDTDPETGYKINKNTGMVRTADMRTELGHKDVYFADRNKPKEEEKAVEEVVEAVKEEEPVKEATAVELDAATPDTTLAVPDTGAGETLGGAVLDPPAYFVGDVQDFEENKSKNAKGSMTTTQT